MATYPKSNFAKELAKTNAEKMVLKFANASKQKTTNGLNIKHTTRIAVADNEWIHWAEKEIED